jgi:hypothetical protein
MEIDCIGAINHPTVVIHLSATHKLGYEIERETNITNSPPYP